MAVITLEKVKTSLEITDTSKDTRIEELIPVVETMIQHYRVRPFDTDDDDNIVYPDGSEQAAIEIIAYKLYRTKRGLPITSSQQLGERININYRNEPLFEGVPQSLYGTVKRYLF